MKDNFNLVDIYITVENVKSHFEYIYNPKKLESQWTNFIVYGLETHNTDRTRIYFTSFYRLIEVVGNYQRDLTPCEVEKCKKLLMCLMVIIVL